MKRGLVLEGGAHRAIYTAGVLDVFAERGIIFDGVIITLDMNKKFTCNTVLRPHSFISFPPSFKFVTIIF